MQDFIYPWKTRIARALNRLLAEQGLEGRILESELAAEFPPQPEFGDLGFPLFNAAKALRKPPQRIAQDLARTLAGEAPGEDGAAGTFVPQGPYLNVLLDRGKAAARILAKVLGEDAAAPGGGGHPGPLAGLRIMVEFSSPNTNKPLHLGHLRNGALGESVSRLLAACGAEVLKVCIFNDRGAHICKSMLAYQLFGQGKTPASEGVKGDRFVGDWYVRFHALSRENPAAEARALEMLRRWEAGDAETTALWKQMNAWAVEGMQETYRRTGVFFDRYYFESQTYLEGKAEVLRGLDRGVFYQEAGGAVMADLSGENLDKKALLRQDGTSIYITQDIGTALYRHKDWPFHRLIFVVGSEQRYHFQALFSILKKLGYTWAENLYHLSYGMVNLPEGKMKSREGTVVDADDLLDDLRDLALQEIQDKDREEAVGDPEAVAEKVALGALHYYLLAASPAKDMLFNPKESLSFNGNTGPYLQYTGARLSALLHRAAEQGGLADKPDTALLTGDREWELLKLLASYPETAAAAAAKLDPSILAAYVYELAKSFSRFYHDCPILSGENPALRHPRLALCQGILRVLRDALGLLNIPFLETM
ncbi:MAG: arginine--tRNA ligase [Treponema sp.]|jgi:arginyl-tRNA synthetase|nr:arginine--tRNA ligase [Treponema sp.]